MRLSRWPVLIAVLGVAACAGSPPERAAGRGCASGALDDAATARLLMTGVGTSVPVFGAGCQGRALALAPPREGRRRAAQNGVLLALR